MMRRKLKRTTDIGLRVQAFRCRVERLESRSMLAADGGEVVGDTVSDHASWCAAMPVKPCDGITFDAPSVDAGPCEAVSWYEWQLFEPADGDVKLYEMVDFVNEEYGPHDSWWSDRCWIVGLPADLEPQVPEYGISFFAACGGGIGIDAQCGDAGTADGFDLGTEWTWQDGSGDALLGSPVEEAFGMPLFCARGAMLTEEAVQETVAVAQSSFNADVAAEASETADTPASTSAAIDPRAAAFADMRMMAAVASMPHGVAEAGTFGGSRRRR